MDGHTAPGHQGHILHLTIIVDGIPQSREYPASEKIEEVIKSLLSAGQKQDWQQYQLVDRHVGNDPLDPGKSLADAGVKDKDTLSLTKKEGGGGCATYPRFTAV